MNLRMVGIVCGALAAIVALIVSLPTPPATSAINQSDLPSASFVVRDVRLFDGEAVVERASVRVENGKVVEVARGDERITSAPGVQVVSGEGRTLLPGFIDTHTHSWDDALERALVFGVTTHLDQFGQAPVASDGLRADLLSAGTLITRAGGHGTQFGLPIPTLEAGMDADAFVAARLAEGSRWIKLVIEDGHELGLPKLLPTLDAAAVAEVVAAAHRRGVLAVAHVHALEAAEMAVNAGVDGLVHTVVDRVPSREFAERMAKQGVFVVPTLSVLAGGDAPGAGAALARDARLLPYLKRSELATLTGAGVLAMAGGKAQGMRAVARDSVRVFLDAGVTILAGTDAGNPSTAWGPSLHGELELLVHAGLEPRAALAGATGRAAAAFRLDDRGRIAVGHAADLVLVEGDPTRDITATRQIAAIWKGGQPVARPLAAAQRNPLLGGGSPAADGVVQSFAAQGEALPAGWGPTTDSIRGGASIVAVEIVPLEADGFLRIRGEIRAGFPFPWSGAAWSLGAQPMSPVDLGERTQLRLRTRGAAINLLVLTEGLGPPFTHMLPASSEWTEHRLDLAGFGVATDAVSMIVLSGGPAPAAFEIDIDEIGLWPRGAAGSGPTAQ